MMISSRRSFLAGLFCAPAIVQINNIMPIKVWADELYNINDRITQELLRRLSIHDKVATALRQSPTRYKRATFAEKFSFYQGYSDPLAGNVGKFPNGLEFKNFPEWTTKYKELEDASQKIYL